MNDKIKEIIKEVNKIIDNTSYNEEFTYFQTSHISKLVDCITNLREENEIVHKDFSELSERYFFTKSRCENANKFIDEEILIEDVYDGEHTYLEDLNRTYYKKLKNILNGDDKDEK